MCIGAQLAAPAAAQDTKPQTAWEASRTVDEGDMVTTGVARGRDRLNSATSTSAIKENEIIRLAPRSLVAVLVFMAAGVLTASLLRHWLGVPA